MALLSPLLEKLVLSGKAKLKTTVIGHSGHAIISATEDKLIIIIEFDYQHFVDFPGSGTLAEFIERSVHQLQFSSPKSHNHFIIREPLNSIDGGMNTNTNGAYKKETFLIHDNIIHVNIVLVPSPLGGGSVGGQPIANSGTQQPPLGYGTGATGITQTESYSDVTALWEYLPLTEQFSPTGFTGFPFNVSQFLVPVQVATALNPTNDSNIRATRSYPIVNITYVEILRTLASEIFSTS